MLQKKEEKEENKFFAGKNIKLHKNTILFYKNTYLLTYLNSNVENNHLVLILYYGS